MNIPNGGDSFQMGGREGVGTPMQVRGAAWKGKKVGSGSGVARWKRGGIRIGQFTARSSESPRGAGSGNERNQMRATSPIPVLKERVISRLLPVHERT